MNKVTQLDSYRKAKEADSITVFECDECKNNTFYLMAEGEIICFSCLRIMVNMVVCEQEPEVVFKADFEVDD